MQEDIARNQRGERKMTYIPPVQKEGAAPDAPLLKAAAYIRVSTQEDMQMGSFEMQKSTSWMSSETIPVMSWHAFIVTKASAVRRFTTARNFSR